MSETSIKPIETVYKDYRFRSRLEARWAVFFDHLSVEYQYEPEGAKIKVPPDAQKIIGEKELYYLPDFYLPGLYSPGDSVGRQFFLEVKPSINKMSYEEMSKIILFPTKSRMLIVTNGDPKDSQDNMLICGRNNRHGYYIGSCAWLDLDQDGIGLLLLDTLPAFSDMKEALIRQTDTLRIRQAHKAARQARFEFGEQPQIYHSKTILTEEVR